MKLTKQDKYIVMNMQKRNNPHNWNQGCEECKGRFEDRESFVRVDVQTDVFRGNDNVFCFHRECWKKVKTTIK